jgi:hypothetical protein
MTLIKQESVVNKSFLSQDIILIFQYIIPAFENDCDKFTRHPVTRCYNSEQYLLILTFTCGIIVSNIRCLVKRMVFKKSVMHKELN